MADTELAFASIEEVAQLIRKRKVSPVELTKLMLARIERLNPKLNAYITICADEALAQAKEAEAELFAARGRKGRRDRGTLHGIPVSLKDNIYTAGIRTTAGSRILRDFVPQLDALVVTRLRSAGAVILGKTNMHEFAYGVTTNNPHYGPTRNPWDLERIPGGSSGGSAAAVAAGLCYASIGTDTGGSIRIPAALCGVVGFKPTYDRVSLDGIVPLAKSLDHVGPITRTVTDAAIVLKALNEGHPTKGLLPWDGKPWPLFRDVSEARQRPRKPLDLGLPKDYFWHDIDEEVRRVVMAAVRSFEKIGAAVHEIPMPRVARSVEPSNIVALAEARAYHEEQGWYPARADEYGEDVRKRLEMGASIRAVDYLAAISAELKLHLSWDFHMGMTPSHQWVRGLLAPTVPILPPRIGEEKILVRDKEESVRAALLRLNRPANYFGMPAISLPCGFSASGLPIGLQIIGSSWNDSDLVRLAHAYQKSNPWHLKRPPLAA